MDGSLLLQQLTGGSSQTFNCADAMCNGPNSVYATRDVLTDPPTVIHIVPPTLGGSSSYSHAASPSSPAFRISYSDIEPTAGWLGDRNRSSLDICFMHSFRKCTGKTRDKDVTTCHQIHVKWEVLDALRRNYVLPQRRYFCRTMKANITEKVSRQLWNLARKRFSLQYLEFKTEDIDVTAGSTAYEVEYRRWLTTDSLVAQPLVKDDKAPLTDNYISTTNLCWEYAVTGRCTKGASCLDIHGLLINSLSKHRYVKMALKEINRADELPGAEPSQGLSHPLQASLAAPKMFPTQPQFYTQAPQSYYAGPSPTYTIPSMPSTAVASHPSGNAPQNSLLYVLVEGSDHIFRIVPLAS